MRKLRYDKSIDEPTINLTPLIDVVFVVLIIFILVAPMLEIDNIKLASAAAQECPQMATPQENHPISIHVRNDNTILFNHKLVTEIELLKVLKEAKRRSPHSTPQLFHDKQAYFGTYQTVKNSVEMAGFEEMDVILQPR